MLIHSGKILRRFKIRPHLKWSLLEFIIRFLMYLLSFSYRKLSLCMMLTLKVISISCNLQIRLLSSELKLPLQVP